MSLIRLMFIAFRYLQNRYADRITLDGVCHAHEKCVDMQNSRLEENHTEGVFEPKKIGQMPENLKSFDSVNQIAFIHFVWYQICMWIVVL